MGNASKLRMHIFKMRFSAQSKFNEREKGISKQELYKIHFIKELLFFITNTIRTFKFGGLVKLL